MITREAVKALALGHPAATHIQLWGRSDVYKVGGKVFATCGLGDEGLSVKVSPIGWAVLTEDGPGRQAPYFARGHWAFVALEDLTPDEAKSWIDASYDLVTSKLTRAARKALGIG
jgi:predicted DNA-binding protein (MmcQ/YjbR family)